MIRSEKVRRCCLDNGIKVSTWEALKRAKMDNPVLYRLLKEGSAGDRPLCDVLAEACVLMTVQMQALAQAVLEKEMRAPTPVIKLTTEQAKDMLAKATIKPLSVDAIQQKWDHPT